MSRWVERNESCPSSKRKATLDKLGQEFDHLSLRVFDLVSVFVDENDLVLQTERHFVSYVRKDR